MRALTSGGQGATLKTDRALRRATVAFENLRPQDDGGGSSSSGGVEEASFTMPPGNVPRPQEARPRTALTRLSLGCGDALRSVRTVIHGVRQPAIGPNVRDDERCSDMRQWADHWDYVIAAAIAALDAVWF